ncbi:unnamed protein product [Cunninghamella blakesleeana]
MTLTSEEVNAIVFRYLQESGFRHSSFAFQYESQVDKSTYRDVNIQPGMLINIIHKGLQFMDIETHMNEDGELVECNAPFSLLGQHQCETIENNSNNNNMNTDQEMEEQEQQKPSSLSSAKRQRKEERKKEREKRPRKEETLTTTETSLPTTSTSESTTQQPALTTSTSSSTTASQKDQPSLEPSNALSSSNSNTTTNGHAVKLETEDTAGGDEGTTLDNSSTNKPTIIDSSDAVVLTGHKSEVFSCSWNPVVSNLLVSGSGDGTARLWKVPDNKNEVCEPIVLEHLPNSNDSKDVTTIDWNPSGTLLATGSYDGQARIWTQSGLLRFVMSQHKGPVFSLKWNMKGDLIISGSADTTTVVWDPETGEMKQQFKLHTLAILDVDWMDNTTFASCSNDKTIYVCRVGEEEPLKKWVGHEDEINAVRWDPSGQYLASCADDKTTKIWSLSSDHPIQEIKGHSQQVYTLQWAPVIQEVDGKQQRILATGSFDATIRLWDALNGTCLHVLFNHSEAIYSISFSPDAKYLASGSFDELLNVWNTKNGTLQKTFKADGGIFEVHFNKNGNKLAACTSDKQVVILDMKS